MSGLSHHPGKVAQGQLCRGFESRPLRQRHTTAFQSQSLQHIQPAAPARSESLAIVIARSRNHVVGTIHTLNDDLSGSSARALTPLHVAYCMRVRRHLHRYHPCPHFQWFARATA